MPTPPREEAKLPSSEGYDVLYTILAVHPEGTLIPKLEKNLAGILKEERENPLIGDNFHFNGQHRYFEDLGPGIINLSNAGLLTSWNDNTHETKPHLYSMAERAKSSFTSDQIEYLQSLGRRLETR